MAEMIVLLAITPSPSSSASLVPSAGPSSGPGGTTQPPQDKGQHDATFPIAEAVVLSIALLIALAVAAFNSWRKLPDLDPGADPRDAFFRSRAWRFVQTATMGLLIIAAAWSTWPNGPSALTVTLLILIIMVTLVPVIEKVVFPGGGEIDVVKREIKTDSDTLAQESRQSQIVLALAAEVLAESQSTLLDGRIRNNANPIAMSDLANRVLSYAVPTLSAILAPPITQPDGTNKPGEELRFTVFGKTNDPKALRCVYVFPADQAVSQIVLGLATDQPSNVFRTGQAVNVQQLDSTQRPPQGSSANPFGGIAIVPWFSDGQIAGIVNIERGKQERFDAVQMALTRAMAALFSAAFGA